MFRGFRGGLPPIESDQAWMPEPGTGGRPYPLPGNPQTLPIGPGRIPSGRWRAVRMEDGTVISFIFDPHHYARCNGSQAFALPVIANGQAGQLVLPESGIAPRNFLGLRNASALVGGPNVAVNFGGPADNNAWLLLTPGTMVLLDVVVPQDDVYAAADAANGVIIVTSSTTPGNSY